MHNSLFMKHNKYPKDQKPGKAGSIQTTSTAALNQSGIDSPPPADEISNRAYFSYLNQGSLPGHDVQHWLEAEAEFLGERNLTRVHGHQNHT